MKHRLILPGRGHEGHSMTNNATPENFMGPDKLILAHRLLYRITDVELLGGVLFDLCKMSSMRNCVMALHGYQYKRRVR
jgi:hypothetical protein